MTDGVKGGDVNRPGSVPEIKKLPRTRCTRCEMLACAPIITDGRCRNEDACQRRVDRLRKENAKP